MKLVSLFIIYLEISLLYELVIISQGNCVEFAKGKHQQVGTTIVKLTEKLPRDKRLGDNNTISASLSVGYDLDLTVAGSKITLHLQRNDNIPPAVPIYVMKNGNITQLNIPSIKKKALYLDKSNGASIEYECFLGFGSSKPDSCRHLVSGHFQLDNRTYFLEPDVRSGLTVFKSDDDNDVVHVIYEIQDEHDFKTDYIEIELKKHSPHVLRANKGTGYTPHKSSYQKRATVNYKVEFLPELDYPIYKFWYDRSNATTAAARDVDAIMKIREFYAFVLNSINLRYQSIVSPVIAIQVMFAGIFIADTPNVSTWTENNKVSATPRDQVDTYAALTAFRRWLALQKSLPAYDHAMAFTGYDLHNGTIQHLGMAWSPGACTPDANSISVDHFEAIVAAVAAHELGHNLGSKHDGDGNMCSAEDKYVMSPRIGVVTDARANNHYKFSTCSVTQIESYIAKLDRENKNCLLTLSSCDNLSALDSYADLEAGLIYSADVQCEAINGPGSYLCRWLYTDISEVCARLMCFVPENDTCTFEMAWEGTVCGTQKLCRRGVCTCDVKAPLVPDDCPQGDLPGIYFNNMTCAAAAADNPYYCLQTVFLRSCCETCRRHYTGIKGCEYGDRNTDCKLSSCPNYLAPIFEYMCCGTCKNISATPGNTLLSSTCPKTSARATSSLTSATCTAATPEGHPQSEKSTASRILFQLSIPVVCILMTFYFMDRFEHSK